MAKTVILGGARTPIGKMSGGLASFSAAQLGSKAIAAALERSGVSPEQVEYVILGQVLQAGAGQNPARPAAAGAGIPMTTPSATLNKVCLSGLNAVAQADWMLRLGEASIVVAGGMESMTNAPYLLTKGRQGYKFGDATMLDAISNDGLTCGFDEIAMGEATDRYNSRYGINREDQDAEAARSHELAATAQKDGLFDEEIVPVEVPQRRGDPVVVKDDEGIRPGTTAESLGKLRPAFVREGTITAGNASQISDGACALVLTTDERAADLGIEPIAEVVAHGQIAGEDPSLHTMPSRAVKNALVKTDLTIDDIDLFEFNEAFAAVSLVARAELGVPLNKVNVNGGAISLGHPIGMSGARIVLHAIFEQKRRGGGHIAAGICGGGGQGDALICKVY